MKITELTKNNILIAEFMGFSFIERQSKNLVNDESYLENEVASSYRFNSDWNWLMGVIEKIQKLDNDHEVNVNFTIYLQGAVELKVNNKNLFSSTAFEVGTLIDAVYKAVIEFIKWYNKNK